MFILYALVHIEVTNDFLYDLNFELGSKIRKSNLHLESEVIIIKIKIENSLIDLYLC